MQQRDDFCARRSGSFNDADLADHLRVAERQAGEAQILRFLKRHMRHH